jgi:hypothetical protein
MVEQAELVAPGVKNFISGVLRQCRLTKDKYYTIIFNISMIVIFSILVGGFLYYKYKGKLTPQEIAEKQRKEQEYIMKKIGTNIATKKQEDQFKNLETTMLTNLPNWNNHPELPNLMGKNIEHSI